MSASPQLAGPAARAHEKRLSPRKKVSKPLPIELLPGKEVWLENLCEGGLRVSGSSRLQPGTTTFLNFQLPSSNSSIEAAGVVAWSDTFGNVGVRFTRVKPDSTAALKRWLKNDGEPMSEVLSRPEPEAVIVSDDALEQRIRALQQVSELQCEIAAQQLDASAALDLVARRALQATRATGAAIALREGADVVCRASVGNAPDVGVKLTGSGLSGECLRSGVAISMSDSETDERVDREACRALQIRSLAVLPVVDDGKVEGIVEALSSVPNNFDSGDLLTLSLIAELVAGIGVSRAPKEAAEFDLDKYMTEFEVATTVEEPETPAPDVDLSDILAAAAEESLAGEAETSISLGSVEKLAASPQPATVPARAPEIAIAPTLMPVPPAKRQVLAKPAASVVLPRSIPARAWRLRYVAVAAVLVFALIGWGGYLGWHLTSRKASSATPVPAYTAPADAQRAAPIAPATEAPAVEDVTARSSTRRAAAKEKDQEPARAKDQELAPEVTTTNEVRIAAREDKALAASRSGAQPEAAPAAPAITGLSGYASALPDIPSATPRVTVQSARTEPSVQEGKLIHRVMPVYPEFARRSGITGTVIISATVTKDGHLKNLKVLTGNALLAEEALRAARQWRYTPYLLNGKPIEAETRIAMNFNP